LYEALLWIVFHRIPIISLSENNIDCRIDNEIIDGIEIDQFHIDEVTQEEYKNAGLPINPYIEAKLKCGYCVDPKQFDDAIADTTNDTKKYFLDKKKAAEHFFRMKQRWDRLYANFIERQKIKLYSCFCDGTIEPVGKLLPVNTIKEYHNPYDSNEYDFEHHFDDNMYHITWTQIPRDFWLLNKIYWRDSMADGTCGAYCLIVIDTEQLFEAFPPPNDGPILQVSQIGSNYIFTNDQGQAVSPPPSTRGRPSLPWDEFHVEMARRLQAGELPDKQEAAIEDMREWCHQRWQKNVGRSTLLLKIKPYYDAFFRKSEKE